MHILHQTLFNDFPALIWQSGTDAKCYYFNRTWLEFTGRSLEQELGDGWTQGVHPRDLEKTVRDYMEAFRGRQPFEIEYRLMRHDGEYRDIVDYGRPFATSDGTFAGYIGACYDVTERNVAHARTAKSEALMAEAQALAHFGSWEWDIRADVVTWSDELYRMMGLQPQECPVRYDFFLSCVHPDDRERVDRVVRQVLADHRPLDYECRTALPSGSGRTYHVKGGVVCDKENRPLRMLGSIQDITEQTMAKEALRQSEQLFAAFMDNLPAYAWMKDAEGRYIYVNRVAGQLPEHRSGSKGKTDDEVWPAEIAAKYRAFDRKAIESGQPFQTVGPYLAGDEVRHSLASIFPVFDQAGAVVMVGGAAVDITERIRAEEALRESEERFRQLAEHIEEVFWIRSAEPARVEYVSRAYEKIWKRSVEDVLRNPDSWMEAIHPGDRERLAAAVGDIRTKGELDQTYRIVWPDGTIRWIRDRAFPVRDAQGALIRVAGIAEDITDRKRAEQQVENFGEMLKILTNRLFEMQEEERRHIARELHDEIGQSLTAAKLEILLAKQLDDPVSRTQRLDDSLAIVEQLLQSVRALSLDLRPPLLDEIGLAAALSAHAQMQTARAGLGLRLVVDKSLPRCDPAVEIACFRVAQEALTNILRHARATKVEIDLRRRGDELQLKVRDNGTGFDVEATNARVAGGASFGMLSMRERVHLTGGRFECKSAPGKGTKIEAVFLLAVPGIEDRFGKSGA